MQELKASEARCCRRDLQPLPPQPGNVHVRGLAQQPAPGVLTSLNSSLCAAGCGGPAEGGVPLGDPGSAEGAAAS